MADVNINVKINGTDQIADLNEEIRSTSNSVAGLKERQEELEAAFQKAEFGTPEWKALQKELRAVNTDLANIEASVEDLTIADKVDGFLKFGQAAAGAMSVATAGVSAFGNALGVSEEQVKAAEESLMKVIAAAQGMSDIASAFSKDNKLFASFLSIGQGARTAATGMTTASTATGAATTSISTFGKVGKAALISVGIGVFTTALALLVEYWDDISAGVKRFINSVGPLKSIFDGISDFVTNFGDRFNGALAAAGASISALGSALARLVRGDFEGAKKAIEGIGTAYAEGVKKSQSDKALNKTNEQIREQIRLLERRKAQGDDTAKTEEALLQKRILLASNELQLLDEGTKEYEEKTREKEDLEDELTRFQKTELDKRLADQKAANEKRRTEAVKQAQKEAEIERQKLAQIEAYREAWLQQVAEQNKTDEESLRNLAQIEGAINAEIFQTRQDLLLLQNDAEQAATEAQLEELQKRGEGESAKAVELQALLIQQKIRRIEIEKATTEAVLTEQEKRAQAEIDAAISGSASPEALAQAETQKAAVREQFSLKRQKLEAETAQKIAEVNKKVDTEVAVSADDRAQKVVESLQSIQQIAGTVSSVISSVFSTAQAGITEQISTVQATIDSLDAKIADAQSRLEAAQSAVTENDQLLTEARSGLAEYAAEQTDLYDRIRQAQAEGNTAALVGLRTQQNELRKRIQSEQRNTTAIEQAKSAAQERADAEAANIERLNAERAAAAEQQKQLELEQIELQKQRARVDRITALVNVGLAIATIAAQSAKQDFTFGAATIASIVALAASLAAAVTPMLQEGFAEGGFTGRGKGAPDSSGFRPAGIVHEGEYVIPKRMVDSPTIQPVIAGLESIRTGRTTRGFAEGGFTTPSVPISPSLDMTGLIQSLNSRPIVVSVVDINRESARLAQVQQQSRL